MKKVVLSSLIVASSMMAGDLQVELGYQQNKFDADFAYGNSNTRTVVSESDIGLEEKDSTVKPRLFYMSGNHTFDFDYESLDFSGSKNITRTIVFDDKTYTAGANVQSTLEIDWYRFGYRYKVLGDEKSYLNLGLDINLLKTDVGLDASALNISSNYSETLPVPTLVINGNYSINDMFGIEGKFAGISAGSKASYTEYFAGVNMKCLLLEGGKWKLGYQAKNLEVDVDDFDGELDFKGVYLGFNYTF